MAPEHARRNADIIWLDKGGAGKYENDIPTEEKIQI